MNKVCFTLGMVEVRHLNLPPENNNYSWCVSITDFVKLLTARV